MWPQTGNKSCSISLPCQSFKRVPGDVFVPPGRCLCCGGRAERWRSRAQRCWSCLIRGEKHPQQSSATECLWMRRLRSVSGACPWVSVEALTGVLGVELSSTCCCRAPAGAAGVSGGRAFQFFTFFWWEMELSHVQSVFGARQGGCWEPTSLVEVCVIARGLWPLSQLLSGRSLFSFVSFFFFLPSCSLPSPEPVCRAEMETIRGENPHLGFSVG